MVSEHILIKEYPPNPRNFREKLRKAGMDEKFEVKAGGKDFSDKMRRRRPAGSTTTMPAGSCYLIWYVPRAGQATNSPYPPR
jgi:hypothetical protein